MIPTSILDLSLITQGDVPTSALRNSGEIARHAEACGFTRYWVAEHHGRLGIASAATSVLIGYIASQTSTIRVGAGGIMLPNHAPLIIAEQFGTLAALYPDRIELGLGRAPGTDQATARALRRRLDNSDDFPRDVQELLHYFEPAQPGQSVVAIPGAGSDIPVWLLGSSLYSAHLAALLGLPFAFASHFAPQQMDDAATLYRREFRPSARLAAPHLMLSAVIIAADTPEEADYLATSHEIYSVALRTGEPGMFPAPVRRDRLHWAPREQMILDSVLSCRIVGSGPEIAAGLNAFVQRHQPDEMLMVAPIFDHAARKRSLEVVASLRGDAPSTH